MRFADLLHLRAMLRPATPEDLPILTAIARREDVARTLATDAPGSLAAALADEAGELLVIEDGGKVVGAVRWVLINRRSRIADIRTLMLDPAARGRGVATLAVRELARRLFLERWLHRVEAEVYGFNLGGRRVFERAGFVQEGIRRRAYDREDGWQDGVRYGLLSDELERTAP
jgi:RimJ/RimL family protein N-acetyltransferase